MRRVLLLAFLVAAAGMAAWFGARSPPAPSPETGEPQRPLAGWDPVEGLPAAPSSYAEGVSGRGAVVSGVVYFQRSPLEPWLKFVTAFDPTGVRFGGDGLFVVGAETAASRGAPLMLRVLPVPSDVVPLPCLPGPLSSRGNRWVATCNDGKKALVGVEGFRSFEIVEAPRGFSIDAAAVGTDNAVWVALSSTSGTGLARYGCDAGLCASRPSPALQFQALRAGENGIEAIAVTSRTGGRMTFSLFRSAETGAQAAAGSFECEPGPGRPTAAFASRDVAFVLCNGRLTGTSDRGDTFLPVTRERVDQLWAADGWVAVVVDKRLWRRAVR